MDDTRYSYEVIRDAICASLGIPMKSNSKAFCRVVDRYNHGRGKPVSRCMLTYTKEDVKVIKEEFVEELEELKKKRKHANFCRAQKAELIEWLNKEEK